MDILYVLNAVTLLPYELWNVWLQYIGFSLSVPTVTTFSKKARSHEKVMKGRTAKFLVVRRTHFLSWSLQYYHVKSWNLFSWGCGNMYIVHDVILLSVSVISASSFKNKMVYWFLSCYTLSYDTIRERQKLTVCSTPIGGFYSGGKKNKTKLLSCTFCCWHLL